MLAFPTSAAKYRHAIWPAPQVRMTPGSGDTGLWSGTATSTGTARHGMAWHGMAIKMMTGRFPLIVPDYPTWRSGEHNNRLTCGFGAAQDRSILLRRNSTKNSANKDSANPTHKGKFKPYPSSTPQPEIQVPAARPTLTTDTYSVLTSAFG